MARQAATLKIAMIGHKSIPSRSGGVEIVVHELATRLVRSGHIVHAYNRSGRGSRLYQGVRIIRIPTFTAASLNALVYSILATVRALFGRYDVIHFHAQGPSAMLWLPHLLGIRTVATIHGLDWQRAKWGGFASRYLKFGEKIAARFSDELIVLSRNNQAYFQKTYGRQATFIPNGVVPFARQDDTLIKEKFGLVKDSYILFLARLVPEKGLHYLIDAYRLLQTDLKLVIAGGSGQADKYLAAIKSKVAKDPRIIMTDFIQDELLAAIFYNAYIYVLPSDVEGMPLSLLEAMSCGNCCLVSDIPENTELAADKAASFQKGNVLDLADKLDYLLQNPQLVADFKKSASAYVCSKYNWDDVVAKTSLLYRSKEASDARPKNSHG